MLYSSFMCCLIALLSTALCTNLSALSAIRTELPSSLACYFQLWLRSWMAYRTRHSWNQSTCWFIGLVSSSWTGCLLNGVESHRIAKRCSHYRLSIVIRHFLAWLNLMSIQPSIQFLSCFGCLWVRLCFEYMLQLVKYFTCLHLRV